MRRAILLVIAFYAVTGLAKGRSKSVPKVRYPRVESVFGLVRQVEDALTVVNRVPQHKEKLKKVKKGSVFRDKALLRSGEKSGLRILLNSSSTLVLYENTEVRLPDIEWKDGAVSEIQLLHGSLRYSCQKECDRKIVTPLYESVPPVGDYLIVYDPTVPRVDMSVLSGEAPFRGLENEESVVLHAGEKASFQGVLENNQPAFDILLHDRKVAKGKLSEVQKLPKDLVQTIRKQDEERARALRKGPKPKRLPSQICDKPWGELNQCAWICEKNKKGAKECRLEPGAQCVRVRCNANGEWSDRTVLPEGQSPCQAKSFVGACDY